MKALYLGRFQIFHNGHLNIIKHIESEEDIGELVIAIGSSQYSRDNKHPALPLIINPFTYEERETMLEMSLNGQVNKPFTIIGIRDTHVCDLWFNLVMHYAKPDVLYTNAAREIKLFESKGIQTRRIPIAKEAYHAQVVREMIMNGDDYEKYVPKGTDEFIKKYGIETMLKNFYKEHPDELESIHERDRKRGIITYDEVKKAREAKETKVK